MKPRILISDKIHDKAIQEAREFAEVTSEYNLTPEELIRKIPEYDALIVRSATKVSRDVIYAGSNLKIIGRAGVGLDNIDVAAAKEKGIKIVNSPEASSISVAEHVMAMMLALYRKISIADSSMKQGRWDRSKFGGNELYGKTLGIIGFGRIGREVAMRARAFGMEIMAYDPQATTEDCREYNAKYCSNVDDILREADVITLHVPLVESTRNLINEEKIRLMKPGSIIINAARGGIINEGALCAALSEGRIAGAAIDVYETEPPTECKFTSFDNVLLTPHLGASTEEAQINAGTVIVEKMRNFFRETIEESQ